jgi:hypothetical protein
MTTSIASSANFKNYILVTLTYWEFTVTDGAVRLLVLLYFNNIGYTPIQIASLFLFYEIFGVVTNFLGGVDWLTVRFKSHSVYRNWAANIFTNFTVFFESYLGTVVCSFVCNDRSGIFGNCQGLDQNEYQERH